MTESSRRMLAAIMFTDMAGYTALMQEDESKAKRLRDRLRAVVNQSSERHGGRILQFYGDGVLCSFTSAVEATACALEIQAALREEPKVPARIGIHEGDVVFEDGGIYGDGVNVSSRVQELAVPGGICVSDKVYDELRNQSGIKAFSLGHVQLKNVRRPTEIFALMGDNLAAPDADHPVLRESAARLHRENKFRIAILPLVNLSPDPADEYFSDGMTEELIARLSKIKELRVIARTSVMQYKGTTKTIAQIGRELGVGSVLEGSVRKSSGKLRITEQLIDTQSEEHLWAENYDSDDGDIFAIQGEIAQAVADSLRVRLLSEEKQQLGKRDVSNIIAYHQYLKGRFYWNERSKAGLERGIEYFNKAIEEDPRYPLPYAGLSDSYILLAGYGYMPTKQALPLAESAARKAGELDESVAESHTSLAAIAFHYCDWSTTIREIRRAIELNPSYATAHHWGAVAYAALGRFDEAVASEKRALALDPLDSVVNTYLGWIYYFSRQYDEALQQYWNSLELNSRFYLAYLRMGETYCQKGMFDAAVGSIERASALSGGSPLARALLGQVYAVSGQEREARSILEELEPPSQKSGALSYALASVCTGLNDFDHAFSFLERAFEDQFLFLRWVSVEPAFDPLRNDPRFAELLNKMNLTGRSHGVTAPL